MTSKYTLETILSIPPSYKKPTCFSLQMQTHFLPEPSKAKQHQGQPLILNLDLDCVMPRYLA